MKLFNIAKLAFAFLVASTAASCSDDGYWDDATGGLANNVSFQTATVSQTYKEGEVAPSVTAIIMRGTAQGEQTVNLSQKSDTPDKFGVPTSITFANGETYTEVAITLKDMTVGKYSTVITPENPSISGNKSVTITITVKGESEPADWQSIGEATYREDCMTTFFNVDNVTYKCPIEEDKNHPGTYRLVNPYGARYPYNDPGDYDDSKDYYLTVNATNPKKVYIEQSHTGMAWSNYGEVVIWSIAGLRLNQGKTEEEVTQLGAFGSLQNGIITFPSNQLLIAMMNYNDAGLYQANGKGKFAIALPGYSLGDFSLALNYIGRFNDTDNKDYAVAQVEMIGKDAKFVHIGMVEGMDASAAIEAVMDSTAIGFTRVDSKVEEVRFPVEKSGQYTIAAVTFDSEGAAQEKLTTTFKFTILTDMMSDPNKGWKSLGNGMYTDNLICNIFNGIEPVTYEVEVQEKEDQPGYYRMVNPYGAAYPYNEEGDYDPNTNYYIEIDATSPNCVMIPYQETGLDWGHGMVMIYSYAGYFYDNGKSIAEIEAASLGGKISEGVVSFADETILFSMQAIQDGAIMVCPKGFNLVLPDSPVPAPPMLAPKKVSGKNIVNGFVKAALNANNAVAPVYNREFHAPAGHVVSMF